MVADHATEKFKGEHIEALKAQPNSNQCKPNQVNQQATFFLRNRYKDKHSELYAKFLSPNFPMWD